MTVVFSRRDAEWFAPPSATGRRYLVAPLTYRERQAFRADLAREGGIYPSHAQMLDALRAAVREACPNADPRECRRTSGSLSKYGFRASGVRTRASADRAKTGL
ncbi:hypothetical protein [Falsiroseomonas sp.]|uniref:hypothetical protein n=1 Tax=Falsiroseomonas sp. TaxID=2870721 RepID=UPI0034A26975